MTIGLNMNDRELLEYAAIAAGIEGLYIEGIGIIWEDLDTSRLMEWNPLEYSDDAFNLAVHLGLTVEFGNNCVVYPMDFGGYGTNQYKASRHAIVLAAAEIGKSKS